MVFNIDYYSSPIGTIEIIATNDSLTSVKFIENINNVQQAIPKSGIINETIIQLDEYFNHKREKFNLPVQLNGTGFQVKVWNEILTIPFNRRRSYSEIAVKLGSIKKSRAVAAANGKNQLLIVIPCHRVIGENGSMVGYAGGLWRKKWLLEHESREKQLALELN